MADDITTKAERRRVIEAIDLTIMVKEDMRRRRGFDEDCAQGMIDDMNAIFAADCAPLHVGIAAAAHMLRCLLIQEVGRNEQ